MTSLLCLHGAGSTGADFAASLHLPQLGREMGFEWLAPDGHEKAGLFGLRGWEDTDAHRAEIEALALPLPEPRYLIGHSNGAFAALECALRAPGGSPASGIPKVFAGAVVISGGLMGSDAWLPSWASSSLRVLFVHGDRDGAVNYRGGLMPDKAGNLNVYLGPVDAARLIAAQTQDPHESTRIDLIDPETWAENMWLSKYRGEETRRDVWRGGQIEVWTIEGAGHVLPSFPGLGIRACRRIIGWAMGRV